jgi:hypothetical protein
LNKKLNIVAVLLYKSSRNLHGQGFSPFRMKGLTKLGVLPRQGHAYRMVGAPSLSLVPAGPEGYPAPLA